MRLALALALLSVAPSARAQTSGTDFVRDVYVDRGVAFPEPDGNGGFRFKTGVRVPSELAARQSAQERESLEYRSRPLPSHVLDLQYKAVEGGLVDELAIWEIQGEPGGPGARGVIIGQRFSHREWDSRFVFDDNQRGAKADSTLAIHGDAVRFEKTRPIGAVVQTTWTELRARRAAHCAASKHTAKVGAGVVRLCFQGGRELTAAVFQAGAAEPSGLVRVIRGLGGDVFEVEPLPRPGPRPAPPGGGLEQAAASVP